MYCRKCGKEITENAIFCPYCGVKVEYVNPVLKSPAQDAALSQAGNTSADTGGITHYESFRDSGHEYEAHSNENIQEAPDRENEENKPWYYGIKPRKQYINGIQYYEAVIEASPLKTRWFNFLIHVSFPLGIIELLVLAIVYFAMGDLLKAFIYALADAYFLYTYIEIRKLTKLGYVLYIINLTGSSVFYLLTANWTLLFSSLIYVIPSLIYMIKRRSLFELDGILKKGICPDFGVRISDRSKWYDRIKPREEYLSIYEYYQAVILFSHKSSRFMSLYINIFLPLVMLVSVGGIIYSSLYGNNLIVILTILMFALAIVTFFKMRELALIGYWLNLVLLCASTTAFFSVLIYMPFLLYILHSILFLYLFLSLVFVAFYMYCLFYFSQRKILFEVDQLKAVKPD